MSLTEKETLTSDLLKEVRDLEDGGEGGGTDCEIIEEPTMLRSECANMLGNDSTIEYGRDATTVNVSAYSKYPLATQTMAEENDDPDSELPKNFSMNLIRTKQLAGKEFCLFKNVIHLLTIQL